MRDNINASWPHHAKYNQLVTPKAFRISVNVSSSSIRFPRSKITNPIIPGQSIEDKEFRLDINVLLNNHTIINPEMQVVNELNWQTVLSSICAALSTIPNMAKTIRKPCPPYILDFRIILCLKVSAETYSGQQLHQLH